MLLSATTPTTKGYTMATRPTFFEIIHQNPANPGHYLNRYFDCEEAAIAFMCEFGVEAKRAVESMNYVCEMPHRDTGMSIVADGFFNGPKSNNGLTLVLLAPDA
jgi:hypothetical protein